MSSLNNLFRDNFTVTLESKKPSKRQIVQKTSYEKKDPFEIGLENLVDTLSNDTTQTSHIEKLLDFQNSHFSSDLEKSATLESLKRDTFFEDLFNDFISIEAKELFEAYTEDELIALGLDDYESLEEI